MQCPNCGRNFEHERQLSTESAADDADLAWYKLSPPRKVSCPECGTHLRHSRYTLSIVLLLGLAFVVTMSMKTIYPDSTALRVLFWVCTVALMICVPVVMRGRGYFKRDDA